MLSIMLITRSQGAPELRATITFFTFRSKVEECSGFTSFEWISLSSRISFPRFSSNSSNFAWYAPITSLCSRIFSSRSRIFSSLQAMRLLYSWGISPSERISSSMWGLLASICLIIWRSRSLSLRSSSGVRVSLAPLSSLRMNWWLSFWQLEGLPPGLITSLRVRLLAMRIIQLLQGMQQRVKWDEPSNLHEYRIFCKALKRKIKEQRILTEELKTRNKKLEDELDVYRRVSLSRSPMKGITNNDLAQQHSSENKQGRSARRMTYQGDDLYSRTQIMQAFKQGLSEQGLSAQAVFRISDTLYKQEVEFINLRRTIQRLKLGLTPKEISTLSYIFDDNCNNYVTYSEYMKILEGFQVAQEDEASSKLYKTLCLEKLSTVIKEKGTTPDEIFRRISDDAGQVRLAEYTVGMKQLFAANLLDNEIVASFYAISIEGNGAIDFMNFKYAINSTNNRLATHGSIGRPLNHNQHDSTIKELPPDPITANLGLVKVADQFERVNFQLKVPLDSISPDQVLARLKQDAGLGLTDFYEALCRTPMVTPTTLFTFKRIFVSEGSPNPDLMLVSSLFKLIDLKLKGSVSYSELIYFYLTHSVDFSMILRLLAKYFHNNDLTCERFWFLFSIGADSDISRTRFIEVMNKTFGEGEQTSKLWSKLWGHFSKGEMGKAVLPLTVILAEMRKYEIRGGD